jgi:hypothetical protein
LRLSATTSQEIDLVEVSKVEDQDLEAIFGRSGARESAR